MDRVLLILYRVTILFIDNAIQCPTVCAKALAKYVAGVQVAYESQKL